MHEPENITVNEEAKLIPAWSIVAAFLSFILVEYWYWWHLPDDHHHHEPPFGLRLYFGLSWGLLAALYFLMVGYISKDAPRRGMSARFWMLICLVMPGGIGAVLYFLLRQPELSRCGACGTLVLNEFHFCPQCRYQLVASCGQCYHPVRTADQFCTRCGHELAEDHMPARLHAVVPDAS